MSPLYRTTMKIGSEMATRQARRDEASGHTDSPCQTVTSARLVHLMFDSLASSFVRASDMAPCLASWRGERVEGLPRTRSFDSPKYQ